jgi:hypothetical protein
MSEKENRFKNLSELIGKGIQVKVKEKSIKKQEEEYFMTLIEELCQIDASSAIANSLGINLIEYEDRFIRVFEMTLTKIYGEIKASIILWWVFESITSDGELMPLVDEDGKEWIIKTPTQLYKFLKKYNGK